MAPSTISVPARCMASATSARAPGWYVSSLFSHPRMLPVAQRNPLLMASLCPSSDSLTQRVIQGA